MVKLLDLSPWTCQLLNTVDHSVLLNILDRSYSTVMVSLIIVKMMVHIKDSFSVPSQKNFSVPQGSVAGPILFTV